MNSLPIRNLVNRLDLEIFNNIVYNLLNIIKIEKYTKNREIYDMLFYNIRRLHYKKYQQYL